MTGSELRNFYLTGKGLNEFSATAPLRPAAIEGVELPHLERDYPLAIAGTPATPVPFSNWTPALVACAAIEAERRDARAAFLEEVERCAQRLEDLLAVDDSKSGAAGAGTVGSSLGGRAMSLLNPEAWANALKRRTAATHAMAPERRVRCECALSELRDAIGAAAHDRAVTLIHADEVQRPAGTSGIEFKVAASGGVCDTALQLIGERLKQYARTWRALRVARLELDSNYDEGHHAAHIEGFDWTMAKASELAAVPVVMAFADASEIAGALASFAKLMRSGMPVQIVVACPNGLDEDLGCLPLAYPEAFALSTCTGAPDHLAAGLMEMARTLRPAVALTAVSESPAEAAALTLSRMWPLYRYNPDVGESWRDRFTLQMDRPAGYEKLTPLYAAALLPAFREHFRLIPEAKAAHSFACLPAPLAAVYTREIEEMAAKAERRWRLLSELATPAVVTQNDAAAEERARMEGAAQAIQRAIELIAS